MTLSTGNHGTPATQAAITMIKIVMAACWVFTHHFTTFSLPSLRKEHFFTTNPIIILP